MRARWLAPIAVVLAGCTSILQLDQFSEADDAGSLRDAMPAAAGDSTVASEAMAVTDATPASEAGHATGDDADSASYEIDAPTNGIVDAGAPETGPVVCVQLGGKTFQPDQLPNLLIFGAPTFTSPPTVGQPTSMIAKVQNNGEAFTPDSGIPGGVIGLTLKLPGDENASSPLAYEDTYDTPLINGGNVDLTTSPDHAWTPDAAGPIMLLAVVDDVDRICESNEGDNTYMFTVNVAAAP